MKLLDPFVERPLPIFMATFLIALAGVFCLQSLPVKRSPHLEIPYSFIVVPYPGATPEDVEAEITVALEEELGNIEGLRHLRTSSGLGVGTAVLEFEDRTDMEASLRRVRDATDLAEVDFPDEAEGAVVHEISLDNLPIIFFTLSGDLDQYRLREIAEDLAPSLETVDGVSRVDIFGGFKPEVRVHAEPAVLAQHGLTLADLSATIRSQSRNIPTGQLRTAGGDQTIRATGEFAALEEIRSITVATEPGGPISLRDVADVSLAHERPTTGAWVDGEPSVTLIVRRRAEVNTLETVRELKSRVNELRKTLPPGVELRATSDASREIGDMIHQLGMSAAWGMVLVVLVLLAAFGVRQALLVACVLPFSLLFTFIGLYMFDMSISNIALFSLILVLGLVVDGAIIMGEAIFAEREQGASPVQASKRGLARVGLPVIAADLTTVAAYLPMLMMVGIMGQFMSVMPRVVVFALAGSIFIDHLFLPAAAAKLGSDPRRRKKPWLRFDGMRDHYLRGLKHALRHRGALMAGSGIALAATVIVFTSGVIPSVFLPTADHSRFWIDYALPLGTSLEETNRVGKLLAREIEQIPEVQSFVLTTGNTGALNANPQENGRHGPEFGKIDIQLSKPGERTRSQSEIVELARQRMSQFAGVDLSVEELSDGPPVGAALALVFKGKNLEELTVVARQIEHEVAALPEARDLRVDYDAGKPQVRVELDRARASYEYGISPDQVSRALLTAFHGEEVGRMWVRDERVDIRLRAPDHLPYTVDTLRELPLRTRNAEIIPLGAVASIDLDFTHSAIYRRDGLRAITLKADAAPDASSIALVAAVEEILAKSAIPPSVITEFGGETEERSRSMGSLVKSFFWAVALIYVIIAIQFNSLRQPIIVVFTIALSLVGVAIGLLVTGHPFSFMVFIGIVSLTGIVVNDGIVMVDAINKARRDDGMAMTPAILDAGRRRFRPVLMTTITTIAGLLPLTLQVVEGGEFWVALGVTIISGLLVASILTLFVVPVLYSLMHRRTASLGDLEASGLDPDETLKTALDAT